MANMIKWDGEKPRTFKPSQLEKCVDWLADEFGFYIEINGGVSLWDSRSEKKQKATYQAKLTKTGFHCDTVYTGQGDSMFAALAKAFADFVKHNEAETADQEIINEHNFVCLSKEKKSCSRK